MRQRAPPPLPRVPTSRPGCGAVLGSRWSPVVTCTRSDTSASVARDALFLRCLRAPTLDLIRRASGHCPGPLPLGSPARYVYFGDFRRLRLPLTMSLSWVASPAREAPRERPKCTKSTRMSAPGAPLRLGTLPRRVPDPQPQRSNGCGATRDVARLFFSVASRRPYAR